MDEVGEAQSALRDAEKLLVDRGLIRVEMRYRADLEKSKPILEKFISTDHLFALMRALSGDLELSRFRIQM